MLSLIIILLVGIIMFTTGGPKKINPYNDAYFYLPDRYNYEEYPRYYRNKRLKRSNYDHYQRQQSGGEGCIMIFLLILGVLLVLITKG